MAYYIPDSLQICLPVSVLVMSGGYGFGAKGAALGVWSTSQCAGNEDRINMACVRKGVGAGCGAGVAKVEVGKVEVLM